MREQILLNIDNPGQLEKLYRHNKPTFKSAFNSLYPDLQGKPLAAGWHERLNYTQDGLYWGSARDRLFVVAACLFAALIAKLPAIFSIEEEFFYSRNVGFIVFPVLTAYFIRKNQMSWKAALGAFLVFSLIALFINMLPGNMSSDTLVLSCIHLPLLLWSVLGFAFGGARLGTNANWLGFVKYNGELAVMLAILLISGFLTSALTVNLFSMIGWDIQQFYFNYIVICGLAGVPLVATFITQVQPTLVNKVSPLIARLFSPVALVMLVVYLVAMLFGGKNPYLDREFLLLFNALLVGVMALIFFSVSGIEDENRSRNQILILFLLSAVTLIVNGIALSAVLFRIAEWGITPNRAAILGSNVLMLIHLVYVCVRIFGVYTRRSELGLVGQSLAYFLPVYSIWGAVVTFLFPLIFGFK